MAAKTPTEARDRVCRLAPVDPKTALVEARKIADPWFRCQALSYVARFSPPGSVETIADEAVEAAFMEKDAYRAVAPAAWPLRALLERDLVSQARLLTNTLLEKSAAIEHPVSRLEALFLILQAAFPLPAADRHAVIDSLILAAKSADSWKASDRLEQTALMLIADAPEDASRVVRSMNENRYKTRVIEKIAANQVRQPRPFFGV